MKKRKVSTQVFLCFLMMMFLMVVVGCSSTEDAILNPLNVHSISGKVTLNGSALAGVTITLNDGTTTKQTDDSGNYKFDSLKSGDYTVTPSRTGYMFSPSISPVLSLGGTTLTATADFVATAITKVGDATITGSVSGTTIVAIDESNAQVQRVTATLPAGAPAGAPKTFTIKVPITFPTAHIYRFYLIENEDTLDENIYPLYQGTTTNAFKIASVATNLNPTIALGFIETINGVAMPTNNPLSGPGVSSAGVNTFVPEIVSSGPLPAAGTSLNSLVTSGLDFLKKGSIYKAKAYFKAAVAIADNSNDGDTARFFYAGTRIAGIYPYSDGNSSGTLNSVGDILDRAVCSPGGRGLSNGTMVCPETLPTNTPTGSEMQTFAYDVIRPELEAALANLNNVQSTFTKTWTNPIDSKPYISDYGDVLVYKASIEGALAAINTQYAYNLGADIDVEVNKKDANTVQAFLSNNTSFLTLASTGYSTYLATAKTYLSNAADDLGAAIDKVNTRNTTAYLINLGDATTTDINNAKAGLAVAKSSLTAATVYQHEDAYLNINMSPFFTGLNLRSLLPTFNGNKVASLFPDSAMGGVNVNGLSHINGKYINDDTNHNSIPDILED